MLFRGVSTLIYPKCTKIFPFLFISHAYLALYLSRYKKSGLETDKNKFKNSKKLRKLKEKD